MKITTTKKNNSSTERSQRYRSSSKGKAYEKTRLENERAKTLTRIPEFVGVDSEGIGQGKNHRAVLLGIGSTQYVATDLSKGLQWDEVFRVLYGYFQDKPSAAYVGFYLGYDFNQWLRSLPEDAARMLLTPIGKRLRRKDTLGRTRTYPVRCDGWEIDMLGFKRLSIRPMPPDCKCGKKMVKCEAKHNAWMHICDAGPFFQTSFINVIDPKKWKGVPPTTQAEYDDILRGKNKRATARLNLEMMRYNRLENEVLSRVMIRLATGFASIGIRLAKDQWYGPGASASKWLSQNGALKRQQLDELVPEWFNDICHWSYFGGWFELFSHGIIRGISYNYDINNAYPYATTKLPHLCDQCRWERGSGGYNGDSDYVLLYATVFTKGSRMGAVPYRDKKGSILRPGVSKGWYWRHEIDAAREADLVKKVTVHEWASFSPCSHPEPFTDIQRLYNLRLEVGKDTPQGMAIKLNNNSLYGKFAQSVGGMPFGNWFYASWITSHCRTQILYAIASHPGKADATLMVATDGVCFDAPHPSLPISKKLGEWSYTEYTDLCLFKPGVYWHKEGKEALLKVKSRGVAKQDLTDVIGEMEHQFALMLHEGSFPGHIIEEEAFEQGVDMAWLRTEKGWPFAVIPVRFRMKSCNQALNEGKWERAGQVDREALMRQDSDPESKRRAPFYNGEKRRIDTRIHDLPVTELQTWYHGQVKHKAQPDIGFGFDESALDPIVEAVQIARDKSATYDIEFDQVITELGWK